MKINLFLFFCIFSALNGSAEINYFDYPPLPPPPLPQEEPKTPRLPANLIDLESWSQDFILETKRIVFPEFPNAFNPSIIRWHGQLLMSFRCYNSTNGSTNPFALVWLDDEFNPIGAPQVFELPFHNPVLPSKQQDPRLISIRGGLFAVYNNILESVIHREIRRMFIVELFFDGEKFSAGEPECLEDFEDKSDMRYEKNWVPFEYEGELHLSYSLVPHRVLRPIFGTRSCETVSTCNRSFPWNWGAPRGGTQALLDGDHYLAFFHSWIDRATVQSNGKKISHYVMGAYTFEPHPPFAVIAASPKPLIAPSFYRPPYHKTWKPLRCVFPGGILIEGDTIWLSYGRQDHEIWVAKIDKKCLLESLAPISHK